MPHERIEERGEGLAAVERTLELLRLKVKNQTTCSGVKFFTRRLWMGMNAARA